MLNSYAENEYIPSINAGSKSEGAPGTPHVNGENKNDVVGLVPTDMKVLREKNKYFPLLVSEPSKDPSKLWETSSDLDLSALRTFKEKYPVHNEASRPGSLTDEAQVKIQSSSFEDDGLEDLKMISKIRQLFVTSWSQHRAIEGVSDYHWPLLLIDSLDTLYILGQKEKFDNAVEAISEIDFTLPPSSVEMVDIADVGSRALGGLLSAYELSANATLLEKATDVGNFLLRAFDTPNRVPLLKYFWKSRLSNKFPYQNSDVGQLTSLTLEFIRLSQLIHENKFFDAAQRVYRATSLSLDEFDLENLLPTQLDASGCSLISSDEINLGKHLTELNAMKSIDENLQVIHCQQTGKFVSLSHKGARAEQFFNMDVSAQSTYSNLMKSFRLLHGNDLLAFHDHYEPEIKKEDRISGPSSLDGESKDNADMLHSSKQVFLKAMDSVKKLMTFCPATPLNENMTMISSLRTKRWMSPATNELHVEVTRYYDMKFERCSLASMLALGSKVFDTSELVTFADDVATGCFQLLKLFEGLQPVELYLDRCESEDCSFDPDLKIKRVNSGFYYHPDSSRSGVSHHAEISTPHEEELGKPLQKILSFAVRQGPSFYDIDELEVDASSKHWKHDPQRPLWVNKMGPSGLLAPNAIEAIFHLYRVTGDLKWRDMGREIYKMTVDKLQTANNGAKGVWKVNEVFEDGQGTATSAWLSQTLKYYFLLFSDSSVMSLDEYIITTGGHFLKSLDETIKLR